MSEKPKINYKLSREAKADVISMIKDCRSNKQVIEAIKDRYNISISSGLVSQMKKRVFYRELSFQNTEIGCELRSKEEIDMCVLRLLEIGYGILEKYIDSLQDKTLSIGEVSLLGRIVKQTQKNRLLLNG